MKLKGYDTFQLYISFSIPRPMGKGTGMKTRTQASTYLHVFQAVLLADTPENILLATLLHLAC